MKDSKVVLIKGNQSEWFEQAIFIMKGPYEAAGKDILQEAERIINNYMNSGCVCFNNSGFTKDRGSNQKTAVLAPLSKAKTNPQRKNKIDVVSVLINICLILSSILLGFMLHKIMA